MSQSDLSLGDVFGSLLFLLLLAAVMYAGFWFGSQPPVPLSECVMQKIRVERQYRCIDSDKFFTCATEVEGPENIELYRRICADKPVDPLK